MRDKLPRTVSRLRARRREKSEPVVNTLTAAEPSAQVCRLPDISNASVAPRNASRLGLGLYKYTTGVLVLPNELERRFGVNKIAIKLWTQQQCQFGESRPLTALLTPPIANTQVPGMLGRILEVVELAKRALETSNTSRAVFIQCMKSRFGLRALRATSFRPRILASDRVWSFNLEMDVDHARRSPLSAPYLSLQSGDVRMRLRNHFSRIPVSFAEGSNAVQFLISGLLRSQFMGGSSSTLEQHEIDATESIQSLFDDLIEAIHLSLRDRQFDSTGSFIDALREGLWAKARSSSLATYLDLTNIEVELKGAERQRVVSNKMYQSGHLVSPAQVIPAPMLPAPRPSRAVVVNGRVRALELETTSNGQTSILLPAALRLKLEIPRIKVIHRFRDVDHPFAAYDEASIVDRLEQCAVASRKTGLRFLKEAVEMLCDTMELDQLTCLELRFEGGGKELQMQTMNVNVVIDGHLAPVYEITFPTQRKVRLQPTTPESPEHTVAIKRIVIRGAATSQDALVADNNPTTVEEMKHVLQSADALLEKLCTRLTFPDTPRAGAALAEALLRTVKFLSTSFEVSGAKVALGEGSDSSRSIAKWNGDSMSVAEIEPLPAGQASKSNSAPETTARADRNAGHGAIYRQESWAMTSISAEHAASTGYSNIHCLVANGAEQEVSQIATALSRELAHYGVVDITTLVAIHARISGEFGLGNRLQINLKSDRNRSEIGEFQTYGRSNMLLRISTGHIDLRSPRYARASELHVQVLGEDGIRQVAVRVYWALRLCNVRKSHLKCLDQIDDLVASFNGLIMSHSQNETFRSAEHLKDECANHLYQHRCEVSQYIDIDTLMMRFSFEDDTGGVIDSAQATMPPRSSTDSLEDTEQQAPDQASSDLDAESEQDDRRGSEVSSPRWSQTTQGDKVALTWNDELEFASLTNATGLRLSEIVVQLSLTQESSIQLVKPQMDRRLRHEACQPIASDFDSMPEAYSRIVRCASEYRPLLVVFRTKTGIHGKGMGGNTNLIFSLVDPPSTIDNRRDAARDGTCLPSVRILLPSYGMTLKPSLLGGSNRVDIIWAHLKISGRYRPTRAANPTAFEAFQNLQDEVKATLERITYPRSHSDADTLAGLAAKALVVCVKSFATFLEARNITVTVGCGNRSFQTGRASVEIPDERDEGRGTSALEATVGVLADEIDQVNDSERQERPSESIRDIHAQTKPSDLDVEQDFDMTLEDEQMDDRVEATMSKESASSTGSPHDTTVTAVHASMTEGPVQEQQLSMGEDVPQTADAIEESIKDANTVPREQKPKKRGVVIALGSNLGDRVAEIEKACRAIDEDPDMRIVDTSCLYETDAMYVEDQDRFVNGACEIETSLEPMELLDRLQGIENSMGRVKLIDKGPRNIDLDIALYRDQVIQTERLTVPHALMMEREFVIRPLTDILSMSKLRIPNSDISPESALIRLRSRQQCSNNMHTVTPLSPGRTLHATNPERQTHVMSILNTTPDSFSDGGSHQPEEVDALRATVATHIAAGATIIDIGGQSSRPGAPDVSAKEEIARVLPAIAAVKSLSEAGNITISIDTYRASVAEAAVKAGAHVINDISAGSLDPDMLSTVARLGCTYIMMHMRGNPSTMNSPENCTYENGLVERVVRSELYTRVNAAVKAGVRRWRIISDPGIGFAKTQEQNLELLRNLHFTRSIRQPFKKLPMLVGTSRKGFIGNIIGVKEAKNRVWGTAATVTQAVAGGADIVRVHDVAEMAQVVKMADAMYRSSYPKDRKA